MLQSVHDQNTVETFALFIWLIIRLIRLVFLAGTVFFSHKKSPNSVFQPTYNFSRTALLLMTGPCWLLPTSTSEH
jgi:hypothetical protein